MVTQSSICGCISEILPGNWVRGMETWRCGPDCNPDSATIEYQLHALAHQEALHGAFLKATIEFKQRCEEHYLETGHEAKK